MIKRGEIGLVLVALSILLAPLRFPGGLHLAHIFLFVFAFFLISRKRPSYIVFDLVWFLLLIKLVVDMLLHGVGEINLRYYFSFFVYAFLLRALFVSVSGKWRGASVNIFFLIMTVHAVFLIIQFISFNYFSNFGLLNLYGVYSPIGPDPTAVSPGPYNPSLQVVKRPNGLNWEPSAAAFWHLYIVAMLHAYSGLKYQRLMIGINYFSVFATFSALAWIGAVGLYVAHLLDGKSLKRARINVLFIPLLVSVLTLSFGLWSAEISGRLSEIGREETSGYIRVVAPFVLAKNNLSLLGAAPLGDKSFQDEEQFTANGRTELSGIANSYIEFFYYFGFLGVGLVMAVAFYYRDRFKGLSLPMRFCLLYTPLFGGYMLNAVYIYSVFAFIAFLKLKREVVR